MRIGIIEDDNLLRKALDTSLKNQGYTTILAGSRKEAIKNIDSSVDLLIVDIGLPDGDGINLYQELQKNGRIPAIFLTAKDDEKDINFAPKPRFPCLRPFLLSVAYFRKKLNN